MAKLIIKAPGAPATEIELKPGVNRLGRSLNTDFQISHPSVSSAHCEIVDTDGALVVKDLGSTNGTLLDGRPVEQSPLQPGQTLRLGEVEIAFAPEDAPAAALHLAPAGAAPAFPAEPPAAAAPPAPPLPGVTPLRARAIRRPESFYRSLPDAFVFPFRRNGLILLVSGTAFFVVMNFLSGFAFIFSLALAIFTFGYLFSFLQSIITTSAMGEDEMPGWPEYDGWGGVLGPFFQLLVIFLVCQGPAFFYARFASDPQEWLTTTLKIAGLLYWPMALLAVTMYDSLMALNPMLIVLSIFRVPLQYAATCLVLGLLFLGSHQASVWLDENVRTPFVPTIVGEFLGLYTMTVIMRVAGLLFYTTKHRLGWSMGGK